MKPINPLLLEIPTEVSTERLLIRPYRPGDGATYYHVLRENRDHLFEFLPPSLMAVKSVKDAEVLIRRLMADWQLRTLFIFGVWEKAGGNYVGESYLANADWDVPRIELGYFIIQSYLSKGYATEAACATLGFAFEHLKVARVELQAAADNPVSQRVAENCGFVYEGRQRWRHRKKAGDLVDIFWYGMLLLEWQKLNEAQG
jgi:RimJ/RimL family protein N-acetyltransferase